MLFGNRDMQQRFDNFIEFSLKFKKTRVTFLQHKDREVIKFRLVLKLPFESFNSFKK